MDENGIFVTRTPLRVSFAGGGTDFPDFFEHSHGAVLSTTINKYIYVTVKRHGRLFNEPIRLNYSETELVPGIDKIKNAIARECLRFLHIDPPVYVSVVSDIPASSGLGSSSSFAVGLLKALHAFKGERVSAGQLAEEATSVELDILARPMGLQDQYAAAYGGLNLFKFLPGRTVTTESPRLAPGALEVMFDNMQFFWTGIARNSSDVLNEQKRNIKEQMAALTLIRNHVIRLKSILSDGFVAAEFGRVLDESWRIKRQLASGIATDHLDRSYEEGIKAGALGGKICGAGGGGFLLFIVPPEKRAMVRSALSCLMEIDVGYESHGSELLFPFLG